MQIRIIISWNIEISLTKLPFIQAHYGMLIRKKANTPYKKYITTLQRYTMVYPYQNIGCVDPHLHQASKMVYSLPNTTFRYGNYA